MSGWEAPETEIAERAAEQQNGCFRAMVAEMESGHGAPRFDKSFCGVSNSCGVVRRVGRGKVQRLGAGSGTWHEMRSQMIKEKRRCDS